MRPVHLSTTILLVFALLVASPSHALQLCGQKVRATGQLRDGSSLRLRDACRANEIAVDPGLLGGAAPVETLSFTTETVIGSTATMYLSTDGRITHEEHEARTPLGSGTLRKLRCYVSDAGGGGGLDVAAGAGSCDAPLVFSADLTLVFAGADARVAKETGATTVAVGAGQCVSLRVRTLGMTTSVYLNCTLERLPG